MTEYLSAQIQHLRETLDRSIKINSTHNNEVCADAEAASMLAKHRPLHILFKSNGVVIIQVSVSFNLFLYTLIKQNTHDEIFVHLNFYSMGKGGRAGGIFSCQKNTIICISKFLCNRFPNRV